MKIRKYKKFRMSKHKYPTYVQRNGMTGILMLGHETAARDLPRKYGKDASKLKPMHTRFEWVWGELIDAA